MSSRIFAAILVLVLTALPARTRSERATLLVHRFTVSPGVPWPYDMKQLATETVAELQRKNSKQFDVLPEASASQGHLFTLDGEVTEWHPGNRATLWRSQHCRDPDVSRARRRGRGGAPGGDGCERTGPSAISLG